VSEVAVAREFRMKTAPWAHQQRAFDRMLGTEALGLGYDPRLGKSKVVIDVAGKLWADGTIDALVVLAPNSVHENWALNELPAHCGVPHETFTYRATLPKAKLDALRPRPTTEHLQVLCLNVDGLASSKARSLLEFWLKTRRCFLVADESHLLKNPKAERTKYVLAVAPLAVRRAALSGTWTGNGAEDLYTQFEFLKPGCLGYKSWWAFRASYCVMGGFENRQIKGYHHLDELARRMEPWFMRARRSECFDVPPNVYKRFTFELSPEHRRLYDAVRREALEVLDELVGQEGADKLVLEQATVRVLRLQQVARGIDPLTGKDLAGECAGLKALLDYLDSEDHPRLVWCRFVRDVDRVCALLGDRCFRFDGSVPLAERMDSLKRFQAGERQYIVGTPQVGGVGLTMSRAEEVIYYSNDYNLINRTQSEDRGFDAAATVGMLVTDFEAKSTIDGKIIRALREKRKLSEVIMNDPRSLFLEDSCSDT
jgi:SNF2 family DNA or RNA helicase